MNDYGKAVMHGMSGLHKAVRECYPSRKLDHARYIGTGERYDRSRAHYNNHTSPCRNAPLTSSCCPQCWAPPNQSRSKELCREASPTPFHCKQCWYHPTQSYWKQCRLPKPCSKELCREAPPTPPHCKQCWYHPTQSHWKQCRLPKPCSKELCREASLTPSHCKQCWYHPTQSHWKQCRCRLTPPRPPGSNILSLLQSNLQQCWVTGPWLLQHLSKTQQQSTSRHTLVTGPPTRWLSWLDDHVILCSAMSAALLLISVSWVDQKVIRILYLPLGRTNTAPTWPTLPCDILTRAYATLIEILADQIVLRSISAHFGVYMRPSVGPQVVTEGTTPQYHTTIIAGNLTLLRDTRIWWLLWIIPTWLHWMAFWICSQHTKIKERFLAPTCIKDRLTQNYAFNALLQPPQDPTCRGGKRPPPQQGQSTIPALSTILPYIEKQISSHCQVHAINAYLGGPHVKTGEIFKFGERHHQILLATRSDLGVRPLHFTSAGNFSNLLMQAYMHTECPQMGILHQIAQPDYNPEHTNPHNLSSDESYNFGILPGSSKKQILERLQGHNKCILHFTTPLPAAYGHAGCLKQYHNTWYWIDSENLSPIPLDSTPGAWQAIYGQILILKDESADMRFLDPQFQLGNASAVTKDTTPPNPMPTLTNMEYTMMEDTSSPQRTSPPNTRMDCDMGDVALDPTLSAILPYIEKQIRCHCQVHAINAYLGGPYVDTEKIFKFGERHHRILKATRNDLCVWPNHFIPRRGNFTNMLMQAYMHTECPQMGILHRIVQPDYNPEHPNPHDLIHDEPYNLGILPGSSKDQILQRLQGHSKCILHFTTPLPIAYKHAGCLKKYHNIWYWIDSENLSPIPLDSTPGAWQALYGNIFILKKESADMRFLDPQYHLDVATMDTIDTTPTTTPTKPMPSQPNIEDTMMKDASPPDRTSPPNTQMDCDRGDAAPSTVTNLKKRGTTEHPPTTKNIRHPNKHLKHSQNLGPNIKLKQTAIRNFFPPTSTTTNSTFFPPPPTG